MKSVRRRMIAGKPVEECKSCDFNGCNSKTYREHFNRHFAHKKEEVLSKTDDKGKTSFLPISIDYRVSNLCNFKCRMCGYRYSAAWEAEDVRFGKNRDTSAIKEFMASVAAEELREFVDAPDLEEIYWAGGEPLLLVEHWKAMAKLVQSGRAAEISVRYNTNLSTIEKNGVHLFRDLLVHFKKVWIGASIDGAGRFGEFLRTGLVWERWLRNFQESMSFRSKNLGVAMDITLTLPGLIGLRDLMKTISELGCDVDGKMVCVVPRNVLLSPLILPKNILHSIIDDLLCEFHKQSFGSGGANLMALLEHLRGLPTIEELMGPEWVHHSIQVSRMYFDELDQRRQDGKSGSLTLNEIMELDPRVALWWRNSRMPFASPMSMAHGEL